MIKFQKIIKLLKFLFFWWMTFLINMWLTYLLVEIFSISRYYSYFISVFLVALINFITSLKFTFKASYSHKILLKYSIALISMTILNYIITNLSTNFIWEKYLYVVIFLVTTFFFFAKFYVYDKFVFNKKIKA